MATISVGFTRTTVLQYTAVHYSTLHYTVTESILDTGGGGLGLDQSIAVAISNLPWETFFVHQSRTGMATVVCVCVFKS